MKVLLLSTYELGHQPLAVARPAAYLAAAGHDLRCLDLAVEALDLAAVRDAALIGISTPMHTAMRLGVRLAERVRASNPAAHVCFYGLYAGMHADVLLAALADSVIGGEFESPLVALADRLAGEEPLAVGPRPSGASRPARATAARAAVREAVPVEGVIAMEASGGTYLGRQAWLPPRRDLLPGLERYAHLETAAGPRRVGYVEASRGCAHRCTHCPITPVYGGRLRIVDQDVVLQDIAQLVALGAEHITFGDPDFFNGIRHSLRIVEAMHATWPDLTFDATIKVEHLLEHREHLPALRRAGCSFVVSAVEAIHDHVLERFAKGHTAADVSVALGLTAAAGIPLRPTFVAFTPWITLEQYLELLAFVARNGLVRHVDPVQLAIRLLVPHGSALLGTGAMQPYLGAFDRDAFAWCWTHPDPRMDRLQVAAARVVEEGASAGEDAVETFAKLWALAHAAADRSIPSLEGFQLARAVVVPRLSEPWFC